MACIIFNGGALFSHLLLLATFSQSLAWYLLAVWKVMRRTSGSRGMGFRSRCVEIPFSAQLDRVPSHFIHEKTAGETGQERPKKQRHKEPTKPKEDTKIMSSTCAMIDVSQDDDPADGAEAGFLPS